MQTQPSLPAPNDFNIPDIFDGFSQAAVIADPANWNWKNRSLWELADEDLQEFKKKWYGATGNLCASVIKDNILSLWPLSNIEQTLGSSIIVRESYIRMFDVVWAKAMSSRGREGVIITGQPGIGKSLFQCYLLVRLLQQKQVVLFTLNGSQYYLFYHDGVYIPHSTTMPQRLSLPKLTSTRSQTDSMSKSTNSKGFIWSLLDIFDPEGPPNELVCLPCLPVQTASPDPVRYRVWRHQYLPLFTGLPLWSREELAQALPYQERYHSLLDALSSQSGKDPLSGFPGVRALLDEHEEGAAPLPPPDALNYLLDAAIDRFGYSARDVFKGVFNYTEITWTHQDVFQTLSYADLKAAVTFFSKRDGSVHNTSNHIVALTPHYDELLVPATWTVNFKSGWVAKSVFQALDCEKETEIRQQMTLFKHNPQTKAMAGWYFKPLAHRYLVRTSINGDSWPLFNMVSDHSDPPRFVVDTKSSDDIRFAKVKRKAIYFQSLPEHLENKTYYIPVAQNFPLVDAFTVDLDPMKKSAIVWALQITTSSSHRGSTTGYWHIRKIIAHLKSQLEEDPPPNKKTKMEGKSLIEVRYLLVVPDINGSQDLSWQFPSGWNASSKMNDHRGHVYCLELPLEYHPTTL